MPVLHVARPGKGGQHEGLEHQRRLRGDDHAALGQPIGDGPGHEGEAEHRTELQRPDEP
jgi:hypothetical protein